MTAIAIALKRGGLLAPIESSWAVGPEGLVVKDQIAEERDRLFESISLRALYDPTTAALRLAADEASRANWDGYDARKMDPRAYETALRLVECLPTTTPIPEVAADPDGEVSITWQLAPRNVFSVSAGPHGRLSYAGLFGASKTHGTEWLRTEIPQVVLDGIARVHSDETT